MRKRNVAIDCSCCSLRNEYFAFLYYLVCPHLNFLSEAIEPIKFSISSIGIICKCCKRLPTTAERESRFLCSIGLHCKTWQTKDRVINAPKC